MRRAPSRFTLAEWRSTVAEMYARIRRTAAADQAEAWREFRAARDRLFDAHPDTPLPADRRGSFQGLDYFPYDPSYRVKGEVEAAGGEGLEIPLADDGVLEVTPAGRVRFELQGRALTLTVFWLEGYGGGLWLPFGDATSGDATFGGGRYLYDTIKGADLGVDDGAMTLDFNYAYNPSCAYNPRWVCPLVPRGNVLPFAVKAGEKAFR